MSFQAAGKDLVARLERGLYEFAKDVMRESLVECPISGPETYIETWGTKYRTLGGRVKYFDDDDPYIVGDEGTLRRSARVFPPVQNPNGASVTLGYGYGDEVNPAGRRAIEYAVPVHERHELEHDPPTKSGYLLDPLLAAAPRLGPELAATAKRPPASGEMAVVSGADLQEGL
jgi:hypothetical protein